MSLRDIPQILALAGALVLATLISGCTLTPVHADRAALSQVQTPLRFESPRTRNEQIVYQALSARLATTSDLEAPVLWVRVSTRSSQIGETTRPSPVTDRQVMATVSFTLQRNGDIELTGSRTASAGYQTVGNILADDIAQTDANERAIRMAADAVRAALLAQPGLL